MPQALGGSPGKEGQMHLSFFLSFCFQSTVNLACHHKKEATKAGFNVEVARNNSSQYSMGVPQVDSVWEVTPICTLGAWGAGFPICDPTLLWVVSVLHKGPDTPNLPQSCPSCPLPLGAGLAHPWWCPAARTHWTLSSCLEKCGLFAAWAETLSALPNFERKPSPLKKKN